jgi:hypothetical protein
VNRFNTSTNQNWRIEQILTMENWKWNNIKLKNPIFIFDLKHPFSYFSPLILYPSKTQRLRSISYKLGSISYIKNKLVTSVFTANLVSQDWNKYISIYYVHIPPTYFYFSGYKSHIHMHKFSPLTNSFCQQITANEWKVTWYNQLQQTISIFCFPFLVLDSSIFCFLFLFWPLLLEPIALLT